VLRSFKFGYLRFVCDLVLGIWSFPPKAEYAMRIVSCHDGRLQFLAELGLKCAGKRGFVTGLKAIDSLTPNGCFASGAIHELLYAPADGRPMFFAAVLGQATCGGIAENNRSAKADPTADPTPFIWCDPEGELYPPALAAMGIDLSQVYVLRPKNPADEIWAITECLRCKGAGAVVASPRKLSRIEARRLQLAAETGGTVGLFLRPTGPGSHIYAAATRWLVSPFPGQRTVQRWKIQLVHGHGGRIGQSAYLERCRETHSVRALEKLADRPAATAVQSLTA
jgi:protein ImuA